MIIKLVTGPDELRAIRNLQEQNLKRNLSSEESEREGFVTAEYTVGFLERMHQFAPSVIAKEGNDLAGYALAATKDIRGEHELLGNLFDAIDSKTYDGKKLSDVNYLIVGQLCVAKKFRGQQLVNKMYDFFRESYANKFEYLVTDIDEKNPRSLRAHLKSGFIVLDTLEYGGAHWHIVLWDWKK
jgi:hypothetical protein